MAELYARKFLCFVFLMLMSLLLRLSAQDYTHLEDVVKETEQLINPKISDNGKWIAWYSFKDDLKESKVIFGSSRDAKVQFSRLSVSKFKMGQDAIALLHGNQLEIFDLNRHESVFFENVKSFDFLKTSEKWVIQQKEQERGKILIVNSTGSELISELDQLRYYLVKNNKLLAVCTIDKGNEVYLYADKKFEKIYRTENEVMNVWESGINRGGYLIAEKDRLTQQAKAVFVNNKGIGFRDLVISDREGFEKLTLEQSDDPENLFLTFSKLIPAIDASRNVQVWYGNEKDLSKYTTGYMLNEKVLWNPVSNRVRKISSKDFEKEVAVGKEGLVLRLEIDKDKIENRDSKSGRGYDRLFVYDSRSDKNTFLANVYGKMVIRPDGKLLLAMGKEGWMLYNIFSGKRKALEMSVNAQPYFSGSNDIVWVGDGKVLSQNISSLLVKKLVDFKRSSVDLIFADVKHTAFGTGRHFATVDLRNLLVLKVSGNQENQCKYVGLKNGKLTPIVEATSDHISEFQRAEDAESFVWLCENFNKPPEVMSKLDRLPAKALYASNAANPYVLPLKKIVVHYQGSGGVPLSGTLFLPSDVSAGTFPVVTHIYELQHHLTNRYFKASFLNNLGLNEALLLHSGIGVFLPDISYSDKGPAISALESVENAMKELLKLEEIDKTRIGLTGQSFGGYETSFIASHSNYFKAFIAGAAVTDIVRFYYGFNKGFSAPDYWRVEGRQYEFNDSLFDNQPKYMMNNPILYAKNINAPILLWTGTGDTNVDFEHTRSLYLALRKYGKNVISLFYKNDQHSLLQEVNQRDLTLKTLDWWNFYLKDVKGIEWINTMQPN